MEKRPESGIYQHYKGKLYHLLEVGRHSETLEEYVIYRQLYGDYGLWVRPLEMFQESVMYEGTRIPRFKFLHRTNIPTIELNT